MLTKKKGLTPKRKGLTPKGEGKKHLPGVKYHGPLDRVDHPTREDLVLVHVDKAPDDPHFPKVSKLVPPETYYAFDPAAHEVVHMVSFDAFGLPLAWDTDRDGRYFRQARRPLIAPRSVEYCWDSSSAFAKKEDWGHFHPHYRGSLGSRRDAPGRYADYNTPTTRAAEREGRNPLPKKAAATEPAKPKLTPKAAPGGRKPLPRRKPVDDGGILHAGGVDHDKLRSAAEDMADRYGDMFPSGSGKRTLSRKRR